jgi:hypothetical protein
LHSLDSRYFDLKIRASIVADAFWELHNDNHTKYSQIYCIGTTKTLKNTAVQNNINRLKLSIFPAGKVNSVAVSEPTIRWFAEAPASDPL